MSFDSPYPIEAFRDVRPPKKGDAKQRVRVYGIFYKHYSFVPDSAGKRPDRDPEVTAPAFILLHIEPDAPIRAAPLLENPFFWTWMSLLVFGSLFFFVMSRIERKESAAMHDQNLRIKRRQREVEAARGEGAGGAGAGEAGGRPPDAEPPPARGPSAEPSAGPGP